MNKTAIKNFAIWARRKLIADVSFQAGLAGVTESGIANELPQSSGNVKFYDIGTKDPVSISGEKIRMRQRLVDAIREKEKDGSYPDAFRFVVEKVAYTWFNRLIAIRFMEVNDYLPGRTRVLSSENPMKAEPDLVTNPFDADLTFSDQEKKKDILRMKDENRLDELFRFLFIRQCHELHKSLPMLFDEEQGIDRKDSYLDLLLTISFTDKDGVLWHLVHDIPEDDFNVEKEGQVEIIGWMYQYYNTEPKDQVFANLKKNIKISKDNIPAATQLFTPDWIVRYMVENSLGRLWVEGHPNEELKKSWKYYLEEAEQEPQVQAQLAEIRKEYAALHPEEIKVIDPCMGSGHILVYLFDVLMQIYESQGWTQREAAQSIVQDNLYGLDIDDRAAQLAYFAVMMKARQYDRRFLERGIVPHVYGIQESNGINREHIKLFGKGMSLLEKNNAINQLNEMLDVLRDAMEYGSILDVKELDWELLHRYTAGYDVSAQLTLESLGVDETLAQVRILVEQAQVMAQKYHAVVTNPPYMGSSGMGIKLGQYIKDNFPDSKSDLFSVCIERFSEMVYPFGVESMITMESWMFLSSFERMRAKLNRGKTIISLVHMPYLGKGGTSLGINFGTDMAIIMNSKIKRYRGTYDRIAYYETDDDGVPFEFPTRNEYYKQTSQEAFSRIPGEPIAYWVSDAFINSFKNMTIGDYGSARLGMATANNDTFLRLWFEVDHNNIGFNLSSREEARKSLKRWFPHNKGGEYRKWYGNFDYVVDWYDDGKAIQNFRDEKTGKVRSHNYNLDYIFKDGITWTFLSSGKFSSRRFGVGFLCDATGCGLYVNPQNVNAIEALLCSNVTELILNVLNPTISFQPGNIASIPVAPEVLRNDKISYLADCSINLSKNDWDSFEPSWDFKQHPFVWYSRGLWDATNIAANLTHLYGDRLQVACPIETCWLLWQGECNERFSQLKCNEEELNRIFIDIYGLQDELTPEVADRDVTVRRADLGRDVRSLLSYAVGCMLGRYSLDVDGLAYAGGEWDCSRYTTYLPDPDNCIPITDEPYFEDDIVGRFVSFIRTVYGEETLEENLDFIAKALGNKGNTSREVIRNYFLNDFIKDHIKIYQKRPIYWLFDSGKQNGFKALVYMHRWNADTVGNLRVEYLHRMQRVYEKEIERMQDIIDNSRDNREVNQASKRREKLVKQLKEARDYDAKIAHVALSRVEIDLDDGVKVNYEKVQKGPDGKSLGILAKI